MSECAEALYNSRCSHITEAKMNNSGGRIYFSRATKLDGLLCEVFTEIVFLSRRRNHECNMNGNPQEKEG